jgi:2-polyprenyl-3-methyl-5-hydroxy-6-metoxy-1,4-benzoquinol methylase
VKNNCILCSASLSEPIYKIKDNRFGIKGVFKYKTCSSCRHIQLDPLLDQENLIKYYSVYYNSVEKSINNKYINFRKLINTTFLGKIYNWLEGDITFSLKTGSGRLLEIGCNEGKNLAYYSKNGFETCGLETNIKAANKAKTLGFKVFHIDIEHLSHSELFDVIVLPNVLEHVANPIEFLKKVKIHLKNKGELWISLPNKNSIYRKIFGSNWINWHPPFHISQFDSVNLEQLIHSIGLSVDSLKYVTPSQWVSMSFISSIYFKPEKPTKQMRSPLLLLIFILSIKLIFFLPITIFNKKQKGDCIKLIAMNR